MEPAHGRVLLYFIHDTSAKQHKTRGLVDHSLDLVVGVLPLAPQLAPMIGSAVGRILADAGLLGGPESWRPQPQKVEKTP